MTPHFHLIVLKIFKLIHFQIDHNFPNHRNIQPKR